MQYSSMYVSLLHKIIIIIIIIIKSEDTSWIQNKHKESEKRAEAEGANSEVRRSHLYIQHKRDKNIYISEKYILKFITDFASLWVGSNPIFLRL